MNMLVSQFKTPLAPLEELTNIKELAFQSPLGEQGNILATPSQSVSIKDVLNTPPAQLKDKPLLRSPEQIAKNASTLLDVKSMSKADATDMLNMVTGLSGSVIHMQQYTAATNAGIERITRDILTDENNKLAEMFPTFATFDENEVKQLSQAANVLLVAEAIGGEQLVDNILDDYISGKQSLEATKNSPFIGIISSDILVELKNLLSKIRSIINTTDRQLQADFLKLKTLMVQNAAETTIQEGKAAFQAALMGFVVSIAMTTVSALGQAKQLHTQTKAINTHGTAKNNFNTDAQKSMELSRSSMVKTGNKSVDQQNSLAGARHQDAANRSRLEADKHDMELNRITNETRQKTTIIETFGRLSDNLGQVVSAAVNQEVKVLEAYKIILQDIGETARAIANDKDKQSDTSLELMKKFLDILKEMIEAQIRTFQTVATRG